MFSTDGILGRDFAIASSALDGLALRQQVHSENIANIDTKGYQAKTVDFEKVLSAKLKGDDPGLMYSNPLASPDSSSVRDAQDAASLSQHFSASNRTGQPGVDRTTEVSMMMNDNIRFRVLTQQVTNSISAMRSVISEMGRG
jgi:flagellar basal-body rod protein FlgB